MFDYIQKYNLPFNRKHDLPLAWQAASRYDVYPLMDSLLALDDLTDPAITFGMNEVIMLQQIVKKGPISLIRRILTHPNCPTKWVHYQQPPVSIMLTPQ